MDGHREEFRTAIREATDQLGKEEAKSILKVAGTPDADTLLDFTLTILRSVPH